LATFIKYLSNIQKLSLNPLNFQLLSIWTHPYKLGYKIFLKYQNIPDFYFLKK
jgi:hypothetical protein